MAVFVRRVAVPAALVAVFLLFVSVAIALAVASDQVGSDTVAPPAVFLAFVVVGAVILARRPGNRIGLLMCVAAESAAIAFFAQNYTIYGTETSPGSLPFTTLTAWLNAWLWMPMLGALLLLVFLFPTGAPSSPRWRPVIALAGAIMAAVTLIFAFGENVDQHHPVLANPLAIPAIRPIRDWVDQSPWVYLVLLVLAVASVVARYRTATGVERQQLKWAAIGFAGFAVGFGGSSVLAGPVSDLTWTVGIASMPVCIGIAVLRYRLYEIDVVIKRTIVYGVLTVVLIATYVVSVIASQALLRPLTGGSELSVAASTLIVIALFQPARRRIQRAVDRRFYRGRYDAERAVEVLASRLRDEVDLTSLQHELLVVIDRTLKPEHAGVWLRP